MTAKSFKRRVVEGLRAVCFPLMKRITQRAVRDFDFRHYLFAEGHWPTFVREVLLPFCGCCEECTTSRTLFTYWYRGVPNFGDLLTPALLMHYGYLPLWMPPQMAQIIAVGSVLQAEGLTSEFSGIILGSGFIREEYARPYPKATILALRGRKSHPFAATRQRSAAG